LEQFFGAAYACWGGKRKNRVEGAQNRESPEKAGFLLHPSTRLKSGSAAKYHNFFINSFSMSPGTRNPIDLSFLITLRASSINPSSWDLIITPKVPVIFNPIVNYGPKEPRVRRIRSSSPVKMIHPSGRAGWDFPGHLF
jgi:hypothetical protein